MKAIIAVSLALAIFAVIFPLISALSAPMLPDQEMAASDNADGTGDLYYSPSGSASADSDLKITLLDDGKIVDMTMDEYLRGAVAAEMPAAFQEEALKAQAVAIRTYTMRQLSSPSSAHPSASVCSDSSCCMAWKSDACLKEKWGNNYDTYLSKISNAVQETDGQYLAYDGQPALAAFHSSSAGKTENSGDVWSTDVPYLVSVDSPETESDVPNYESSVTVSASDFSETILAEYPDANFSGDVSSWVQNITYTASGRIATVKLGGVAVKGTVLRSLFSLRSTAGNITAGPDSVTMTSTGYGHGVGMSQYGANVMAKNGDAYTNILAWYYPGTELVSPQSN